MRNKDWTGNKKSTFVTLGASNHCEHDRAEEDFYSTDPKALEIFLNKLKEDELELHKNIWEPACGNGALSKVLEKYGYNVFSSDLIYRGYGDSNFDFLTMTNENCIKLKDYDILTNPPYKFRERVC